MADEEGWVKQQKKTFTRWANTYMRIHATTKDIGDIYTDLKDGVKLIALIESLSGKPFPMKYNKKPKMDAQRQDNLKMVFKFLKDSKMPLVNIGAEDITKENHRIILALFWAFIQFYSVNSITLDGVSGKEGLLLWCKRQCAPDGVTVGNFHRSWFDGKAFLALLHNNVPHLVDFEAASKLPQDDALDLAFETAEKAFNVRSASRKRPATPHPRRSLGAPDHQRRGHRRRAQRQARREDRHDLPVPALHRDQQARRAAKGRQVDPPGRGTDEEAQGARGVLRDGRRGAARVDRERSRSIDRAWDCAWTVECRTPRGRNSGSTSSAPWDRRAHSISTSGALRHSRAHSFSTSRAPRGQCCVHRLSTSGARAHGRRSPRASRWLRNVSVAIDRATLA